MSTPTTSRTRRPGVVADRTTEDVAEGRIAYYEQESLPRSILEFGLQTEPEQAERTLAALAATTAPR